MNNNTSNRSNNRTNFLVSIHQHENHSWQGFIEWLDTSKKMHFRSELELMNLIHEAAQLSNASEESLRTWEEQRQLSVV